MPYYYRRGYNRYSRRWPYRSWRRFGVSAAQKSGTRRFSISIPVEGYDSVGISGGSHYSYTVGFTPFYSSNNTDTSDPEVSHRAGTLVGSQLYTTYSRLYDEVKLNSMSITISVDQTPAGTSGVKVVSCVDRHVTLNDIRTSYSVQQMIGSAESESKLFSSLQNARIYRYFAARDVGERTAFFDSTLGSERYEPDVGDAYTMGGPLEFIQNGSLFGCFNPIVFLGFSFSSAPQAAGTVYFQYKVTYNLTFRNPKYGEGGAGRSEGFSDMKSEVLGEIVEEAKEAPVKKKEKVVYEEEVLPDDDDTLIGDDEEEQEPLTQKKTVLKKAGKKSSS